MPRSLPPFLLRKLLPHRLPAGPVTLPLSPPTCLPCRAGDSGGGGHVLAQGSEAGPAWPATRESRLMAWANDMFQQVAILKQDLRRSQMEVAGAKEVSARRACRAHAAA